MIMKSLATTTAIAAIGAIGSVAAQDAPIPPSRQIGTVGADWGLPTYLFAYEEMVRRLEDKERRAWQTPEKVFDAMASVSGNLSGQTVYDLGAGTGYFSRQLVGRGAKVIAADPDRRLLSYAMGRRDAEGLSPDNLQLRPIPYDNPMMETAEADWLLVVNTWHMVEERRAYLEKIRDGLKPGGHIAIVNHQKRDTPHGPPAARRISPVETIEELRAAGFSLVTQDLGFSEINYLIIAQAPQ